MTLILDGKSLSQKIRSDLKQKINKLPTIPGLAVVLVGNNPASQIYVNNKEKACHEIGYYSEKIVLPDTITGEEILNAVEKLNTDPKIHGILVQFPLPEKLKQVEQEIIETIHPTKDVDGFHPLTVGKLTTAKGKIDETQFLPCTPYGIIRLLRENKIEMKGKHAVILGRSNLVGKPLGLMLLSEDATVTICHSQTQNLKQLTQQADILITAIGKPEFVDATYIKKGAVVVDVGINRTERSLVGDVNYQEVEPLASAITPVPGGIGPMTIAILMENVWKGFLKTKNSV